MSRLEFLSRLYIGILVLKDCNYLHMYKYVVLAQVVLVDDIMKYLLVPTLISLPRELLSTLNDYACMDHEELIPSSKLDRYF